MKDLLLITIFLLISNVGFGQVKAIVVDSSTRKAIPYVNIWVENENIGTTTNEKGEFVFKHVENTKTIVFSAIGYRTKKLNFGLIDSIVELQPQITELQEAIIKPENQNLELVTGKFGKSNINHYFACETNPWIVARYFGFKKEYNKTPFLKSIKLITNSDVKNSKFNIRLYSVNEKGKPGDYLYNKNILGITKKGKKITEVNVSKLNIQIPSNGFFVAVEWLIIPSNKYEYTYTMVGSKEKLTGISYEPAIGAIPSDTDKNSWIFNQGKWERIWKTKGTSKRYENKYMLLAIELTLTN